MPPQGPVSDAGHGAADARHYPLYLAEQWRLYLRMRNCGLTLHGARLAWSADGAERDYPLSEIRSIRLQRAAAGGRESLGLCEIRFADGHRVTIYGGNGHGFPDPAQGEIYAAFVRDLHARIPEAAVPAITFNAGVTETRFRVLSVAIAAAALLFVALPLVLLIMVPAKEQLRVLGLLGAGAFFCWPMYRLWENNRPRPYSPRALPDGLLG